MKKVLFSLMVLAGFAACTSDDVVISESTGITSDTATAYLTVRISDAGSSTRATSDGYTDATAAEYGVSNAYFYFYDENGEFVSRAEVWNGMTQATEETGYPSVQFNSSTVVVLKGLKNVGYPRYMVTVLNRPSDFEDYNEAYDEPAGTLAELEAKLAEADFDSRSDANAYNSSWSYETNAGIWDNAGNFVMSTTSFLNTDGYGDDRAGQYTTREGIDGYYFVTELQDTDFYEEPVGNTEAAAVDVYVERLAAKVTMAVGNPIYGADGTAMPYETWTDEDGNSYIGYVFTTTIAGDANMNDDDAGEDADYDVEAGIEEGVEDIYIVLEGWALNAKARESYIVKNLDPAWADGTEDAVAWTDSEGTTLDWQSTSENRSFWGKSFNYGDEEHTYPTSSNNGGTYTGNQVGNYDADELSKATWLDDYVMYTSLNADQLKSFTTTDGGEDPEYCAENTNTAEVLGARTSSAITSALVKARAYAATTVDGVTTYAPITLIRYEGMLFTENAYEQKIEQDVIEKAAITIDGVSYTLSQIYTAPAGAAVGVSVDDPSILSAFGSAAEAGTAEAINNAYNAYFNDGSYTETDYTDTWSAAADKKDFTWIQKGQGVIEIEYLGETIDTAYTWIWIGFTDETTGNTVYFKSTDTETADALNETITTAVAAFNGDDPSYAYYEGLMYYSVPIEHLNDSVVNNANGTQATDNFAEGQYGVVRNHSYVLTIGGINELGHAITDENEVIIPDDDEQTFLYVEAQINILAWKDVQQGVTLK